MHIDNSEVKKWKEIAKLWKIAHDSIEEIRVKLLCEMEISDLKTLSKILDIVNKAEESTSYSYMFTPQSEWTGGDSMNEKNFKYRKPHIYF